MEFKNKIFIFLAIILVLTFYLAIFEKETKQVCINEKCFKVEIADNNSERMIGLSKYESLPENQGMLFIFPVEEIPGFWMKDMKFPIDIIWINKNLEIIGFDKNLQPCEENKNCEVYYPTKKIKYVLEINSGLSEMNNFEIGDRVKV